MTRKEFLKNAFIVGLSLSTVACSASTATEQTTTPTERKILALAKQKSGKEHVSLDDHFYRTLGFDSLDTVEFIMEAEKMFDITIPDEILDHIVTPRGLAKAVDSILQKK